MHDSGDKCSKWNNCAHNDTINFISVPLERFNPVSLKLNTSDDVRQLGVPKMEGETDTVNRLNTIITNMTTVPMCLIM